MRSKLAVWSFVLSLTPIALFLISVLIGRWLNFALGLLLILNFYYFIFISLISLVLSIISLFYIKKDRLRGIGFVIIGLVINIVMIIFEVILWINRNEPFRFA